MFISGYSNTENVFYCLINLSRKSSWKMLHYREARRLAETNRLYHCTRVSINLTWLCVDGYEFYLVFNSIVRCRVEHETFLRVFRRFPTTFRRFPKFFLNCYEGKTNVSGHFRTFSEDYGRFPRRDRWVSFSLYGYGAPLGGPSGRPSSATNDDVFDDFPKISEDFSKLFWR